MYNGRQHIQTESIQVKNDPFRHRNGKNASRHVNNKIPSNEKHLVERKNIYKRRKRAPV